MLIRKLLRVADDLQGTFSGQNGQAVCILVSTDTSLSILKNPESEVIRQLRVQSALHNT